MFKVNFNTHVIKSYSMSTIVIFIVDNFYFYIFLVEFFRLRSTRFKTFDFKMLDIWSENRLT